MIPVLGVPVLGQPDLLRKMLASVDVGVETFVIVDNGAWGQLPEATIPRFRSIQPGWNLGVAASWNLIIKSTPLAPWWCIVNFDIEFAPGDLARLAEHMETPDAGMGMLVTPSAFGISAAAVEKVGLFDENFVPGYFEDNDYVYRCGLAGVPVVPLHAGLSHVGSAVIRNDDHWRAENDRTFPANERYYEAKWGGPPRHERFDSPFGEPGIGPNDWTLDLARLRELTWR